MNKKVNQKKKKFADLNNQTENAQETNQQAIENLEEEELNIENISIDQEIPFEITDREMLEDSFDNDFETINEEELKDLEAEIENEEDELEVVEKENKESKKEQLKRNLFWDNQSLIISLILIIIITFTYLIIS